ncbi:MAG: MotA/TolQ/ExbB proton channel family protein [Bacteroidales bacterium]|jgi:biopolymer transport protein ExbB|nr:MotA/TolQ/ExbB proton channel family protein [Bacteroidales bacterium]
MTFLQIETIEAVEAIVPHEEKLRIFDLAFKGGWIMIPIALLLLIAVYVFFERLIIINKASKEPKNFMNTIRDFVMEGKIDAAMTFCKNTDAPIARMIGKGILRVGKPLPDISAAIENVGKAEVAKLERRLAWISICAGASPMLGFLGTVTGMVRVFFNMASAGNNIEVKMLSGGMYEAMVTTVAGLIAGIIAYIAYNYLVSRIENVVSLLENNSTEFMDLLNEPMK